MEQALVTTEHGQIVRPEQMELTVEEIVSKVAKVRQVAESVMRDGVHYGTIPGTPKPTLYKAGGEILCLTFRLAPKYEKEVVELGNGHREYIVRCDLYHIQTGAFFGSGLGSCSTMESKYRYRPGPATNTGKPVPGEYWNLRKSDPKAALASIGGPGHRVTKVEGIWEIVIQGEILENPNIADTYNTCLKIGAKRSYLDAVLKATAASEVYTQDLEDMRENDEVVFGPASPANDDANRPKTAPVKQPQRKSEQADKPPAKANGDATITEPQQKRLFAIGSQAGMSKEDMKDALLRFGYEHSADIKKSDYEAICASFAGSDAEPGSSG